MQAFNVNAHVLHQHLLQLLLLLIIIIMAVIEGAEASQMMLKGQLLSCLSITGEVGWKPNGIDVGLQFHHKGCGEVAQEGETAQHCGPRVLGAKSDKMGPWNVSRIAQVLQ